MVGVGVGWVVVVVVVHASALSSRAGPLTPSPSLRRREPLCASGPLLPLAGRTSGSARVCTPAGLAGLAAGLRDHQLAVFFRNNHFNTLFKYEDGIFLLVTDQVGAGVRAALRVTPGAGRGRDRRRPRAAAWLSPP